MVDLPQGDGVAVGFVAGPRAVVVEGRGPAVVVAVVAHAGEGGRGAQLLHGVAEGGAGVVGDVDVEEEGLPGAVVGDLDGSYLVAGRRASGDDDVVFGRGAALVANFSEMEEGFAGDEQRPHDGNDDGDSGGAYEALP